MPWTNTHTWLFYLLQAALGAGVLASISIGWLHFFKRSGVRRANYFYGVLLIAAGLTLLHNMLILSSFYTYYPHYKFFPIYLTLALPPLLFFHVKLNLYPSYRLRWTDAKHFLLPLGQWLFFWQVLLGSEAYKLVADRDFYHPFYGAMEQAMYISLFFAYLYFCWRYIRERASRVHTHKERKQVWYLRKLVKALWVLFAIHTAFILSDFIAYEVFFVNLRSVKLYVGLGALSYAALVYWLSVYGFQVLFWGRRVFGR